MPTAAFLIDRSSLASIAAQAERKTLAYNSYDRWVLPPPCRPPRSLRPGGNNDNHTLLHAQDIDEGAYGGVLLPFGAFAASARTCARRISKGICRDLDGYAFEPDRKGTGALPVVYQLLTDMSATVEPPMVADATAFRCHDSHADRPGPGAYFRDTLEHIGFPRYLEFPPSSTSGFYGRLSGDAWFDGAYRAAPAAAAAAGSAEIAGR